MTHLTKRGAAFIQLTNGHGQGLARLVKHGALLPRFTVKRFDFALA